VSPYAQQQARRLVALRYGETAQEIIDGCDLGDALDTIRASRDTGDFDTPTEAEETIREACEAARALHGEVRS